MNKRGSLTVVFVSVVIILIVLLIFGAILFFVFSGEREIRVSESQLSRGRSLELGEEQKVLFEIDEEEHELIIGSVEDGSVDIIIRSSVIRETLLIGEEKKFDLDRDGNYDLSVKLRGIEDGTAMVRVKEIDEAILSPEMIKEKMIEAVKGVRNYAFEEEINGTTELTIVETLTMPTFATSNGVVDLKNKKMYSETEVLGIKGEVYIFNNFSYTNALDNWIKTYLKNSQDYFKIEKEINTIKESEIEIVDKRDLHIKLIANKQVIGDDFLNELYKDAPDFNLTSMNIIYDKLIEKIEVEYWLDDNFRIEKIESEIIININNESLIPKEEVTSAGENSGGMRIKSISLINFKDYNFQEEIIIPEEVLNATWFCTENNDCGQEEFICASFKCVEGTRCEEDTDCESEEYCYFLYNYCKEKVGEGESCYSEDHCMEGLSCIDFKCIESS